MFGRPRCPVDPLTKAWVDERFLGFVQLLGLEQLRSVRVFLPTEADFPEVFEDELDPAAVCRRVAAHLGLGPDQIELRILREDGEESAQGSQESEGESDGPRILLEESVAANPEQLVATLALELGRHELRRAGYAKAEGTGPGLSLELYAIFRGFGVMLANAHLRDASTTPGPWDSWHSSHLGGFDDVANGYALGLFAWLRGETKPAWAASLGAETRRHLQATLKYLGKTGDALVQPRGVHREPASLSDGQLESWLTVGSASARINALWAVRRGEVPSPAVATAVLTNVGHDHRAVRGQTLWAIRDVAFDESAGVAAVLDGLVDGSDEVRLAAIAALGGTCSDAAILQQELLPLLEGESPPILQTAAMTLGRQEDPEGEIQTGLLGGLERALWAQEGPTISAFLSALDKIHGDVRGLLVDSPLREDPIHASYLEEALDALEEGRRLPAEAPQSPG